MPIKYNLIKTGEENVSQEFRLKNIYETKKKFVEEME